MEIFSSLFVSAILLGCTYTLVALGYCLFFGVLDVVVFCSGDIAIFGAFSVISAYILTYDAGIFQSLPLPVATLIVLAIAAVLCVGLSLATYFVSVRPFSKSSALMPLLSTIALGTAIKELLGLAYKPIMSNLIRVVTRIDTPINVTSGRNPQAMPKLLNAGGSTTERDFIIMGLTLLILFFLFLFLNKTKMGLSMQAISQNKELAYMSGMNVKKTINITFIIGGIVLAIAGFLLGSYQSVIRFDTGSLYGTKGFSAAVVGGLKSIWGAVIGGMLLGFVEVFVSGLIPGGTQYQNIIAFIVVIIFIVFKPEGILGEKTIEKV
ncbi:MAG TPA: branched-chain amino acid ABC transporter permease [Flexilinea sp.]|nr:branched-chain amino acid ABC transporter permease [Flexilinea sp.]HPS47123.1 branched-chain amino acid ABC transporter permease [Flexilinea sp.]